MFDYYRYLIQRDSLFLFPQAESILYDQTSIIIISTIFMNVKLYDKCNMYRR